jgi:hypothetical protein
MAGFRHDDGTPDFFTPMDIAPGEYPPATPQGMNSQEELNTRDYRQYISWQLVHLLRGLKVVNDLTPIQQSLIEAKSDLIAATMSADIEARERAAEVRVLDELAVRLQTPNTRGQNVYVQEWVNEFITTERQSLQQKKGDK